MLLGVDIGNTTISFAILSGQRVLKIEKVDSDLKTAALEKGVIKALRVLALKRRITSVLVCSVVPKQNKTVVVLIQKELGLRAKVIGKDIKVPIKNKYSQPKQVGQDRLVGAYAAKVLFGSPAIVIDFGTAITFDVLSAKGDYDGGLIVPGIRLSTEALFSKTALLPRIDRVHAPHKLIGKNTEDSIFSGIFNGYGAMCNGLISMISKEIEGRPKIIVTGGHTKLMERFIARHITKNEPHLVFKGLALISKEC